MNKSPSEKPEADQPEDALQSPDRRNLFKKYGAYTAPLVVSLLCPQAGYARNSGTVYSTSAACVADPLGMHAGMTRHCQIDGATPGGSGHTVINPGPV